MEAASSVETFVPIYWSTQRHTTEDRDLQQWSFKHKGGQPNSSNYSEPSAIILYCVAVELTISHKIRLFEFRRLKGSGDISCGPSDRHLVTLPLWLAT